MKKKIALVLSGGAALGFAHIGVLESLEKHNISVDMIVGTSMGGLIAGCYAAGVSTENMTTFATKFKNINFFDFNFDKAGVFSGKGIMKTINKIIPDIKIEDLNKKFACVAYDINAEEIVVFKEGSLRDSVRSTISIPGLFVPFKIDNKILVDGGVLNNLPEDVAKEMGADIIISCDVLQKYKLNSIKKNPAETLLFTTNCCIKELQKHKEKYADILLTPETASVFQMKFTKENTLKAIELGRIECEKHIEEIKNLLK